MKIDRVETFLTCVDRNYLIVRIVTEDGAYGYGDATLNGREKAVQSVLDDYLAAQLHGRNASAIEDTWQSVFRHSYWRGGPVLQTALSGIDMALWDLKGRTLGVPVYELLGGRSRDRIPVYLHAHGDTVEALLHRVEALCADGVTAVRYSFSSQSAKDPRRWYRQPHQDIALDDRFERGEGKEQSGVGLWDSQAYLAELPEVTRRLREEFGPRLQLIHDVHGRLSPADAARAARELDGYGPFFLEDPVEPQLARELSRVREASSVPLAMGELFTTLDQFLPLFEHRLVDYVRADVSHFGGITACMKLAHTAGAFGIRTAFHGPGDLSPVGHAAQLHMDTALYNCRIQEYLQFDERLHEVFTMPFWRDRDSVVLDDAPGLGVELHEAQARRYGYRRAFIPGLRDEHGAVHNW